MGATSLPHPKSSEKPTAAVANTGASEKPILATAHHAAELQAYSAVSLSLPLEPHEDVFGLGAGDSFLMATFLTKADADFVYRALLPTDLGGEGELSWVQMYSSTGQPLPRLKSTQAEASGQGLPIYRYPTNNQHACQAEAWSETVVRLCRAASEVVGHPLNHCVGNLYRNQNDSIGPHKDKMLDILEGSHIVSLSFGAVRPIVLESDAGVQQEVLLPHGSLFVIGPETNKTWRHSIPRPAERCGPRISLTIRQMGSFLDLGTGQIVGQGGEYQEKNWPFFKHDLSVLPSVLYPRRSPLAVEAVSHHIEGGSTFHCKLIPCANPAEVERKWKNVCQEHPEVCHVPYAWICRRQRPQPVQPSQRSRWESRVTVALQGWQNHGEPCTGRLDTAHDSIFKSLQDSGLTDCMAVVVRHWNGERLGLKRLVEAYETATLLAVDQVKRLVSNMADTPVAVRNPSPEQIANPDIAEIRTFKKALKEIDKSDEHLATGPQLLPDNKANVLVPDIGFVDASAHGSSGTQTTNAKEERKLRKAIREIDALEQQLKLGETLGANQVAKIQEVCL